MNTEQLQTMYKRAMEYCVAAHGSEPDYLRIEDNGDLAGVWIGYDNDNTSEYFSPELLTADLDEVYAERKKRQDETIEKQRFESIEREKRYKAQEKERRKQEYLKLKKEFE